MHSLWARSALCWIMSAAMAPYAGSCHLACRAWKLGGQGVSGATVNYYSSPAAKFLGPSGPPGAR